MTKASMAVLILCFTVAVAEAKPRLLLVASKSTVAPGRPILVDVYLYNESQTSLKLPPLEFVSAEWLLDDTTGKRLGRSGATTKISAYGMPTVVIAAGAVVQRAMKLDVSAEAGDLVTLNLKLGESPRLQSNAIAVYCLAAKRH